MTSLVLALALAASPGPGLEARFAAALDSGRADHALAIADSILRSREARKAKPLDVAGCADSLALGLFALGTPEGWQAAEKLFERSLEIRKKTLGPRDLKVALTLAALATLDDYEGEWTSGVKRAEEALSIRRERAGPRDVATASSLRQVGMLRFSLGEYAAAESLVAASLAIQETLEGDQTQRIADNLNNLGEIARAQDRYDRAEAYFRRGTEVARKLPEDAPLRVALINNLAGVYRDLAHYSDAVPLDEESLRLRRQSPDTSPEALATGYLNLAEVYRLQGRNDEAVPLYEKALEVARPALGEGNPSLAPFVNQAAVSFSEAGRLDLAEPLFHEALATTERALGPEHPLVAQTLADLGRLEERRGALAAAESTYRRAITIRVSRLGARHPDVASTRVDLARCLSAMPGRGDRAALVELEPAIGILDSTRAYPESRLEAHALMAAVNERAKKNGPALGEYAVALDLLDSLRASRGGGDATRASFVARHLGLYDRAIALELAAGKPDAALAFHERSRARVLRDQIATAGVDLGAGIPEAERAPLVAEEERARIALARIQRSIEQAWNDPSLTQAARIERVQALENSRDSAAGHIQRVTESLKDRSPVWRSMLTQGGRTAPRAELQKALAPGEVMLEYHAGDSTSWVFAVTGDGKPARAFALGADAEAARELGIRAGLVPAAALERAIAGDTTRPRRPGSFGVAELLSANDRQETLQRKLAALWRVLLPAGLADRVKHAKSAVVVPDGALHLLPFETLVATPPSEKEAVRYWLDVGPPIRYEASATSLVQLQARRAPAAATGPEVLSVSDPSFAGHGTAWLPLPGTRLETAAIRAALGAARVDSLGGSRATEPAVRAALPGHRVLHLATHGFVTERRSEVLAGLVLAPSSADSGRAEGDGLLQLYEIYDLKLDAQLALLSACETARGPRVAGEGAFALSRGFLAAGAERVIASLWRVNDASTADLIGALFRGASGGGDWSARLFAAKRAVRARPDTAEPFHWAPFVITGAR
jgi:CHAT domain-containing protein/tetratricopeptide (TPR) repeat protein